MKTVSNFSVFISLYSAVFLLIPTVGCGKGEVIEQSLGESPQDTAEIGVAAPTGMMLIPAGKFKMGRENADAWSQYLQPFVYMDAFYMDKYEVTNAEYQAFVLANPEWQKDRIDGQFHDGYYLFSWNGNDYPVGKENHPVWSVSWYAAMAYAEWADKRLPTEAEWEYAARGGLVGKKYPWGDTLDSSQANYNSGNVGDTMPVGSYPANGYGLYDMAGNVWEWCLDAVDGDFYEISPSQHPLSDSESIKLLLNTYKKIKSPRVLRGGSWYDTAHYMRCAERGTNAPPDATNDVGFRCVRAVTP